MRRRDVIAWIGGVAIWPLAARAQPPAAPVIGYLHSTSPDPDDAYAPAFVGFHQGLKEAGYVDGRNVTIEYRWARGQYDRLPALAADLVRQKVTMIVATGGAVAVRAAKSATSTIPIVFAVGSDPVKLGLVDSINMPGGNVTGITFLAIMLDSKRLELLRELVPNAAVVAALVNPRNPATEVVLPDVQASARAAGQQLIVLNASTESEIDTAFSTLGERKAAGLTIIADPFFVSRRDQLVALAARHRVPTIYAGREYVLAGGLISYMTVMEDAFREAGVYVGRILKGARPADLPVRSPTKFELVINLKTARSLDLTVPRSLRMRADAVLE
jgi:putative ABC transport system substrate-binding protein